jgi:hypothetical protein
MCYVLIVFRLRLSLLCRGFNARRKLERGANDIAEVGVLWKR